MPLVVFSSRGDIYDTVWMTGIARLPEMDTSGGMKGLVPIRRVLLDDILFLQLG